jgi:hypothetical protein
LVTFHWILTGGALAAAALAWARARRLARRLERLTESYWELRYEQGQLRTRMNRIDPDEPSASARDAARPAGATAFVPLSSLKR